MSEIPDNEGAAIVAVALGKKYPGGDKAALSAFSLTVRKGSFFGLLGPNGAGKTTALSILNGFLLPDSGRVSILGLKLPDQLQRLKNYIGLVPQDLALYEHLTALENLTFFGKLYNLKGNLLKESIERSLEFTQLQDQRKRRVSEFSGGMKRRLNLSVGMLHNPKLLFLDEPTVGIDAQSRQLIHEKLGELNKGGATIIYTTHYMEEAQELCSHVGIIDEGRIIQQGGCTQLTGEQGYENLNDLFFSVTGKKLRDD